MILEWKKYTGSDENIAEMKGMFLLKDKKNEINCDEIRRECDFVSTESLKKYLTDNKVTHYLICQRHPLTKMICQQAKTGQPVFVDRKDGLPNATFVTTKPNWNIPNAEYSFMPFDEEFK